MSNFFASKRSKVTSIWHAKCQLDGKGNPIPNLHNALLALRHDPTWAGQLRYDEMLRSVVIQEQPIDDFAIYQIHEWMQANGLPRIALDPIREAVVIAGRENAFHPIRDWLDGLIWDGVPRLAEWLTAYLGAPSTEYHRQIGTNFLKSMVARIYQPGCKADYMLVLYGSQRIQKSEICRILAGSKYFSDTLPDIGGDHVRVSMHLRGKWLIEIGELAAISSSKVDGARLKSFLSSPNEQYTPKFARNEVFEPRQCLFAGTTNDKTFLRDPTGNSRFWTVVCGAIKTEKLNHDRELLFAEAVAEYRRTNQWWPEFKIETELIMPTQEDHYEADAWEDPVRDWLDKSQVTKPTLMKIAANALEILPSHFSVGDQRRLAAVLRRLGWDLKRTSSERWWEKVKISPP